jgi:hypothetical protein
MASLLSANPSLEETGPMFILGLMTIGQDREGIHTQFYSVSRQAYPKARLDWRSI